MFTLPISFSAHYISYGIIIMYFGVLTLTVVYSWIFRWVILIHRWKVVLRSNKCSTLNASMISPNRRY